MEQLRLSAGTLGELNLAENAFCLRCSWLKLKLANRMPLGMFPGVERCIDAYQSNVVQRWFDLHGGTPPWLSRLGMQGYRRPPHHSRFRWQDEKTNILLVGTPDGVLVLGDGSLAIVNCRTVKDTGDQGSLLPLFDAELNACAVIGEGTGILSPVGVLCLILNDEPYRVALRPETIPPLLARARELYDMKEAPKGHTGCQLCKILTSLADIS